MESVRNTIQGKICIEEKDGFITKLFLCPKDFVYENGEKSELLNRAFKELFEYLDGKRKKFTLPLNPKGTHFQKTV